MHKNLLGLIAIGLGVGNIAFTFFLTKKTKRLMTNQDKINALIDALNKETDELALIITEQLDKLRAGQVNDESFDKLQQVVDRLDSIGKSQAEPLPGTTVPGIGAGDESDVNTGNNTGNDTGNSGAPDITNGGISPDGPQSEGSTNV